MFFFDELQPTFWDMLSIEPIFYQFVIKWDPYGKESSLFFMNGVLSSNFILLGLVFIKSLLLLW